MGPSYMMPTTNTAKRQRLLPLTSIGEEAELAQDESWWSSVKNVWTGKAGKVVFTLFPPSKAKAPGGEERKQACQDEEEEWSSLQAPFILTGSHVYSNDELRGPLPREPSSRLQESDTLVSVDALDSQDNRPTIIALSLALTYAVMGILYFTIAKHQSLSNAIYNMLGSLSPVSFGDFQPSNTGEKVITVIFLFLGMGFVGTFLGVIASKSIEMQEDVKDEWIRSHEEDVEGHHDGPTLMQTQLRYARQRVAKNVGRICLAVVVGMIVFKCIEHWEWSYAVYFCIDEVMGAGLAPVKPVTDAGRWFMVFYALVGNLMVYAALGEIASVPLALRQSKFEEDVLGQLGSRLTEEKLTSLLQRMDDFGSNKRPSNGFMDEEDSMILSRDQSSMGGSIDVPQSFLPPGKREITRDEFVLFMLLLLGRIDMRYIKEIHKVFDQLDVDKTGTLNEFDIYRSCGDKGVKWNNAVGKVVKGLKFSKTAPSSDANTTSRRPSMSDSFNSPFASLKALMAAERARALAEGEAR